ncbi:hypothetical protein DPMN_138672, partial [Dreissena polymorpha]
MVQFDKRSKKNPKDIPYLTDPVSSFMWNTQKPTKASILDGTRDWKIEVDLGRRLVFPNVVQTTLRPDIKLVTIELT